jgi:PAS domain S-box-containing protein
VKHAQETFNHILDTGGGEPREYRIVRPDGTERWISDTGYAVKDGNGKIVRITGIAEDITERKKAEEALATKASLERIISEASRRFLTLTELDKSINACLADIGRFCSAGRAYLFQFTSDGAKMNNTHEWCAPGVKPEIENLQGLPLEMFPWWMKLLEAGGNIHVKNVSELPPEARAEKETLEAQNIKSVLVVPFLVENRLAGFLGFDNVASTRAWGEKELVPLRTLAEIIGTAVTRKRSEEVLQESEERYRLLADNSLDMISRHAADGTVLFVSPSCESVTGYTIKDLLEKPAEFLVHPDDIEKVWSVVNSLQASEDRYVVEHRLCKKDCSVIWVETMGRLFRDMSGNVIEIQCNVRDITERKHAEEALRMSEERLRLQIERMPIALILWDHDFKVMTWNPAAESIFGYSSEEALGRHPYGMIVPKETQPIVDDVWERLIEGDTTAHSVNENNTKDGSLIICSWTNTPLKNHDGSIIGVLSMVQDITEQKHAEEALRQSETKFRDLADMLPQIIFETDVEGNLTFVNHNAFNTFGYTKDDFASGLNAT